MLSAIASDPRGESYVGLTNVEDALNRLIDTLRESFPMLSADLVTAVVRESYTSLARSARTATHLLSLTAQFARQRLTDVTRGHDNGVPQVLFVCVANAGRSQLAAAIGKRYEDWKLDDPAGQGIETVRAIRDDIRRRIEQLITSLQPQR